MYENRPKIIMNEDYLDLRKHSGSKYCSKDSKTKNMNEDYLDLRKYNGSNYCSKESHTVRNSSRKKYNTSTRTTKLNGEGLQYEKELINSGLKKLVSSYNATASAYKRHHSPASKRKSCFRENSMFDPRFRRFVEPEEEVILKSQSELSILPKKFNEQNSPSTPVFQSRKTLNNVEANTVGHKKNKYTTTMGIIGCSDRLSMDKCAENRVEPLPVDHQITKPLLDHCVDSRLRKKYSVLKMPWKRTWTLPVFSPKSSSAYKSCGDNFDRQTYIYDDGTEIDSTYIEGRHKHFSKAFQNQCITLFFLGGAACAVLVVSMVIWLMFGHNFFNYFFKPRDNNDRGLKEYAKYVGGGIINFVTTFFQILGRVLTIPTHRVYQPPPENFRWLMNNHVD